MIKSMLCCVILCRSRARGLNFKNGGPNWAPGLEKFEPHDFRAKNTRTNRIKHKNQFWQKQSHGNTSGPTLYIQSLVEIVQLVPEKFFEGFHPIWALM